jgi:hypothetical protein
MTVIPPSSFVPFARVEPILNLLRNGSGSSYGEIAKAAGWSDSILTKARREGKIRIGVLYSFIGLAAETKAGALPEKERASFTFDELSELFQALLQLRKAQPANPSIKPLLTKVAKELAT